jgi:hypothetical protein
MIPASVKKPTNGFDLIRDLTVVISASFTAWSSREQPDRSNDPEDSQIRVRWPGKWNEKLRGIVA